MITSLILLALLHRADDDTTIHLPPDGAVEIDSRTRDVVLRTVAGDVVTVHGGSAELDGHTLQIDADDRHGRSGGGGPLEVSVPASARVEITSVGGSITITGSPARMHAETVDGAVHVAGGSGALTIGSVAGEVTVTDFHGTKLAIDATNDNVTVTNASGSIAVENVNGAVTLRGIHSSSVSASSVNDAVEFEGDLAPTGTYEFTSQNADVTLRLPASVSARMRVSTLNGELDTTIPGVTNGTTDHGATNDATGKGKHKNHDDNDGERTFVVTYGSGAATVTVDAFNGNIVVRPIGAH